MTDIARLQLRIESVEAELAARRLKDLDGAANKAEGASSRLMGSFTALLAPVATLATAMAALNKLVSVQREFDVLNAGLLTATGSAENAAVAFEALSDFAKNTPYGLAQATEGFTKLVNLGLEPSERALMSYGNTAAAMGKDMSQMIEAVADAFVIWIDQWVGREVRVLDHYEAVGQPLEAHADWLRSKGYVPGKVTIVLPHDGAANDKVHKVSYQSAFRDMGYDVVVIPNMGAGAAMRRVEATRRLFPSIWFDESKTESGRDALGWYHEKRDENRDVGLGPNHDWSSHSADAFGLIAVDYELNPPHASAVANLTFETQFSPAGFGRRTSILDG